MTILQKVEFIWPEGATIIGFREWAQSLPFDERQHCIEAILRQENHRYNAVNSGYVNIVHNGYLWKDQASYDAGYIIDETWLTYFQRYQNETGVKVLRTYEEQ